MEVGERVNYPRLARMLVTAIVGGSLLARGGLVGSAIITGYLSGDPLMFNSTMTIAGFDPELAQAIAGERGRQEDHIELIASENYASPRVLEAQGSVLTNKYAEGYPGKRYYGGCEFVDIAEELAIERAKKLFGAEYANVQPHSGSQANAAVYLALLNPGRHHPGHEPRSWRPSDARRQGEFLGQAVQGGAVRPEAGHAARSTTSRSSGWRRSTSRA